MYYYILTFAEISNLFCTFVKVFISFKSFVYMKYLEVKFYVTPNQDVIKDVLSALIGEVGFESFVYDDEGMTAYIQQKDFDVDALNAAISDFPIADTNISFEVKETEDKNWNKVWEENFFTPIIIDNRCVVHSSFHKDIPSVEYDIIINPQMAFGTGHHETTSLILSELLNADLKGKFVLDMGCGTSILAILASMRGASKLVAIDIDNWCVENSLDNLKLNNINNVEVFEGDASSLKDKGPFDVVIANINRNILTSDMKYYVERMNPNSVIYMSGFYVNDIPVIRKEAENNGLVFVHYNEKNKWADVMFRKP